ncbi:hypothetical protein [Petrachloros mirabilis]
MAQVFRSGAFLQQCWAVHPLCLVVKRIDDNNRLILGCTSCRSAHHLVLSSVVVRASAVQEDAGDSPTSGPYGPEGLAQLDDCVATHTSALSLRAMDVLEDSAMLRCAECRRHYALTVSSFETHQK